MPTEYMDGQLSAEAAAKASSPVPGTEEMPEDLPASHSPGLPELLVRLDSSDGEDVPVMAEVDPEPAIGARQVSEAREGAATQPSVGPTNHQGQHNQERQQPAFRVAPEQYAWASWDQRASADSVVMQRLLQEQADALAPVLRMLGPLSMLAARLMPAGKPHYSKVCTSFSRNCSHPFGLAEGTDACFSSYYGEGLDQSARLAISRRNCVTTLTAYFLTGSSLISAAWLKEQLPAWTEPKPTTGSSLTRLGCTSFVLQACPEKTM